MDFARISVNQPVTVTVGVILTLILVRNYLHKDGNKTGLRLALAGRNREKVETIAQEIGAPELPILIGDSFDAESLDAIASRAEVVITTVGPYAKYGHELVAACVRNATDYYDCQRGVIELSQRRLVCGVVPAKRLA